MRLRIGFEIFMLTVVKRCADVEFPGCRVDRPKNMEWRTERIFKHVGHVLQISDNRKWLSCVFEVFYDLYAEQSLVFPEWYVESLEKFLTLDYSARKNATNARSMQRAYEQHGDWHNVMAARGRKFLRRNQVQGQEER
jgi:hypothetical protein